MTKAKAGTEYLRYIQTNRVTVPKPTKLYGNEPHHVYFDITDAESAVMENRRNTISFDHSFTNDSEDPDSLFHHIAPNIVDFCHRCEHIADTVAFGTI